MFSSRSTWRLVAAVGVSYPLLVLLFTLVSLPLSPADASVGGVRVLGTIPLHLAALAGFGVVLGLAAWAAFGSKATWAVILLPLLLVSLDLDHLPIYIGVAQPIRPAHSLVFLLVSLLAFGAIFRRMDIELILGSSFLGHLGVDTGLFPPFSPITFDYYQLDPFRIPFLVGALVLAVGAGFLISRGGKTR